MKTACSHIFRQQTREEGSGGAKRTQPWDGKTSPVENRKKPEDERKDKPPSRRWENLSRLEGRKGERKRAREKGRGPWTREEEDGS
jgi:hypothetical protein